MIKEIQDLNENLMGKNDCLEKENKQLKDELNAAEKRLERIEKLLKVALDN